MNHKPHSSSMHGRTGPSVTADAAAPGDRRPPVHQIYPAAVFYHNGKGGRVLDVTQPPFNAKGDGVTDDTPALIAAWRFVRDHYEVLRSGDCTYCTQKLDRNWIIYLPDGEYLLSDTVSQGWPALAMNILKGWSQVQYLRVESPEHEQELYATSPPVPALVHGNPDLPANDDNTGCYIRGQYNSAAVYAENNWAIRVIGQSRAKTIIRLQDAAPGFGAGAKKPVLAFCLLQRGSNVNLGNIIENLTIDTGQGNPGAVGLRWNSSNWGGVRNLAIRSGDGQGRVGLLMDRNNATGYHHDLLIEGFEVGIELAAGRETMVTLEYATLTGQRDTAIQLGNAKAGGGGDSLSARKLLIQYAPVALRAARAGQAILLESELTSRRQNAAALVVEPDGFLMARAVRLSGYRTAVLRHGKAVVDGEFIEEYFSAPPANSNPVAPARPSWLPIKDSPLILPEHDLSKWADVDDFGAVGDGVADDTAAIQRALNSGRPVVYFPKANYVVNGTVDIPATVREITWLFGSFHRSHAVAPDMAAMFRVAESSLEPLLLHQSMSAGGVVLDHDADRPVVLEDMFICHHHCRTYPVLPGPIAQDTTIWRLYRNTRPDGAAKEVFVNDCLFFASAEGGQHAVENVRAWVRFLNNENVPGALHAFRRSDVWIFGFKSEHAETLVHADDYSRLEVLGGSFLNWTSWKGPVVFCRDSQIRIVFLMWHWRKATETILQTERWGAVATLPASRFQKLAMADAAVIAVACD